MILIPEMFALGMQARGWIVRQQIVWAKKACMPESVRDRFTRSWEPIFMFSKSGRYFFDQEAVRQPPADYERKGGSAGYSGSLGPQGARPGQSLHQMASAGANMRDVWLLGPEPSNLEHFAAYPTELVKRCILAGTSEKGACPSCGAPWTRVVERKAIEADRNGTDRKAHRGVGRTEGSPMLIDRELPPRTSSSARTIGWAPSCRCDAGPPRPCVVLDPFLGSGTTLMVASRLGRDGIGVEISPVYARMAEDRIQRDAGALFPEDIQVTVPRQQGLFDEQEAS